MAQVTLQLADNGGTANGGVDTSAPQTFQITVQEDNDTPQVTPATFDLVENSPLGTLVGASHLHRRGSRAGAHLLDQRRQYFRRFYHRPDQRRDFRGESRSRRL